MWRFGVAVLVPVSSLDKNKRNEREGGLALQPENVVTFQDGCRKAIQTMEMTKTNHLAQAIYMELSNLKKMIVKSLHFFSYTLSIGAVVRSLPFSHKWATYARKRIYFHAVKQCSRMRPPGSPGLCCHCFEIRREWWASAPFALGRLSFGLIRSEPWLVLRKFKNKVNAESRRFTSSVTLMIFLRTF